MKKFRLWLTALLLAATVSAVKADVSLPHIFGDNMVLQQNCKCPVFGFAPAGEKIEITASWGKTAATTSNSNGRWIAHLQTPEYGGPYTIEIQGKNKIVLQNVMIGEVWLAAGGENMGLPLTGKGVKDTVFGSYRFINKLGDEDIRFINIPAEASFYPETDFEGSWEKADKSNASKLSAVAYFFARKINAETGIPIGIITAVNADSYCESWISIGFLKKIPEFHQRILDYEKLVPLRESYIKWIEQHPKIAIEDLSSKTASSIDLKDSDCAKLFCDESKWGIMRLPSYIDQDPALKNYDGAIWFRRWIEIPPEWENKKLILSLGPIDDLDETFVNGVKVGENMVMGSWREKRVYHIDGSLVKKGEMLIAIRVIDTGFSGGIYGMASEIKIYPEDNEEDAIYLAGNWKYMPTGEYHNGSVYIYDHKANDFFSRPKINITADNKTIESVYNAMINPLVPFKIAGTIWYQGESNIGRAGEYVKLLPQLAHCLRDAFKASDMKFYYAQIAPYDYGKDVYSAELREAQRRALPSISNSGMACLMDIGRKESIYPAYKKEAGERLAVMALNDLYGKQRVVSGPSFNNMSIEKDTVTLTFHNVADGLVVRGAKLMEFEISDLKGVYYPAEAEIVGKNKIIVFSTKVTTPKNVRYCWKNYYKEPSLYNSAGFPASSFTTEKKLLH
jgi:sialate O-acetylesterase